MDDVARAVADHDSGLTRAQAAQYAARAPLLSEDAPNSAAADPTQLDNTAVFTNGDDAIEVYEAEAFEPHLDPRNIGLVSRRFGDTIFEAARRGDIVQLKKHIEEEGFAVNAVDAFNASALYYASLCGHYNADNFDGERAHYAALSDAIKSLLVEYQAANRQRGPLFAFLYALSYSKSAAAADVTFEVVSDGTIIQAHKCILAARSPYFREQFSLGGKWSAATIRLNHSKMNGEALKTIVHYLYTERLMCTHQLLPHVLHLARNCRLRRLVNFLQAGKLTSQHIVADLGQPYVLGSLPSPIDEGFRADIWNHLVIRGVVPRSAFNMDDLTDGSDTSPSATAQLGIYHDVELVTEGTVFAAHRVFLAHRSPYLASMLRFTSNVRNRSHESGTIPRLELTDCSAFILAIILEFIYVDVVRPVPADRVLEALYAADVFVLPDLKPLLVSQAIGLLTSDNVLDFLRVADLYQLHRLNNACIRCIAVNSDTILTSPAFEQIVKDNASSIQERQEHDSVPILDEIKTELKQLHGFRTNVIVADDQLDAKQAERLSRLTEQLSKVEEVAARLGLKTRR